MAGRLEAHQKAGAPVTTAGPAGGLHGPIWPEVLESYESLTTS
jgi:hypothetical protein